jgi:hypothetical protein
MMDCKTMSTPMETNMKLLVDVWVVDVSKEYQTRYMFFCEHLESISGGTQMCSPCRCKTCD